jgi:REP element-mobilizing transposase RayT
MVAPCAVLGAGFQVNMTFSSYHDPVHLYFVTATIIGWRKLFATQEYATIILDSLVWMQKEKRIILFAFVLMPSHLHVIIKPEGGTIGDVVQQFASYTAHELLRQLIADNQQGLLKFFQNERRDSRHQHSIWQDVQAKNIYSHEFLWQKLEYIHNNPIGEEWNLTKDRGDYSYSSACFYDYGKRPIIEVTDVNQWLLL